MTFKEKLKEEYSETAEKFFGCPSHLGYETENVHCKKMDCFECWNREMPGTDEKEVEEMAIDEAIKHWKDISNGITCENDKACGKGPKQLVGWLKELKKARAKLKAIEIRIKSVNVIDLDIDSPQCPMCGVDLDKLEEYAYCPNCGQALTWEYPEEEDEKEE